MILERDEERGAIADALRQARRSRGSVMVIDGPPGAGKSTLLASARGQAGELGMAVLHGRGSELERGVPFGVARQLLGGPSRTMVASDCSPDAGFPVANRGRARVAELYGALVARVWPSGDCAVAPALLAVDDVHWADGLSLDFLAHIALRIEHLPIALLVTLRPHESGTTDGALDALRKAAERTLHPRPLSLDAVTLLARERLGARADDAVCRACMEVTTGNPFYVSELLHALDADTETIDPELVLTMAPASVLHAVTARIGRLGPDAMALARSIAILGDGAGLTEGAALEGMHVERAEAAADALARASILLPGEPLAFAHPLIRSTLQADIGAFAWRRGHRRAAELLLRHGADPERVAVHLLIAPAEGDPAAAEALRAAAGSAFEGGDTNRAAALLRRALDELPQRPSSGALLVELARAEMLSGSPDAAATIEAALAHTDDPVERARALGSLATLAHVRGELEEAVALAGRARAELPEDHPLGPSLLAAQLGAAALHPELQHLVEEILVPMADAAIAGELPTDAVLAAHVAARVALDGPPDTVRAIAERAWAADPLIDPEPQGLSIGWLGCALLWVDDLDGSQAWLDAAVEAADARGAVLAGATARLQRAWSGLLRGHLEDAVADAEVALEAYRDGWATSPWSTPILVSAHVARGDLAEAAEALAIGRRAGPAAPERGLLLLSECELQLARHEPALALASARAAGRHIDERFGVDLPRMHEWRRWAALAAHRLGDDEEGRALIAPAVTRLREIGPLRQLGAALTVSGLVEEDPDEGLRILEESTRLLERSPARLEYARALLELGAALRRRGRRMLARAPLYEALELADGFDSAPLAVAARNELHALGLRPRRAARTGIGALTASERRVAELAAGGLSTPQIAHELHITSKTVETHLGHVYRKLDVRGRAELPTALKSTGTRSNEPLVRSPV